VENFFGAVDDDFSAGFADVFDFVEVNFSTAGANAVDAFNAGGDKRGGYAVETGGDGYGAIGAVVFRMEVDFDSSDASGFLALSEVEFWPE
jgi:hypothetical protein